MADSSTDEQGTRRYTRRTPIFDDGKFFGLVESIPDLIVSTDVDGTITYVSPSVERVLGYARHQMLRKNVSDFVHPDDAESVRVIFEPTSAGSRESAILVPVRMWHRDRRWRQMEAFGKTLPAGDAVVLSLRDITNRVSAEENSDIKLSRYCKQTKLGIIEWDANSRIIAWNPAAEKIFGYSAMQALGRTASFIATDDARDFVTELGVWAMGDAESGAVLNENVRCDGRVIVCSWCNTALTAANGHVFGAISAIADVTDRYESTLRLGIASTKEPQ
jgi:PAS domain S-box-containing protein